MHRTNFINRIFALVAFSSIAGTGIVPVLAQTRRAAASRTPASASAQPVSSTKTTCAGGWSGVVTFTKTLKDSIETDDPGIRKSTDRIKHKTTRDYEYNARAIVDGTDPKSAVVNTNVSFNDTDLDWGQEKVFDTCNSRESGHWFIIEGTDDRRTKAQVSGSARSFNLTVDELSGTYTFNLAFPDAQGQFKHEQHTKRSGHCQPQNNLPYDKSDNEPTKIDGERFSVDSQKIDPNNPNVLSGTKTWGDDGRGQVRTFVYQASWLFTRCPQKLLITNLKFEDMKFPNWDDWRAVAEQVGTIDGNWVRIKAKVLNLSGETKYGEVSFKETYKGDKWDGAKPDMPLKDNTVSVKLDPGEEREVEVLWDTSGYAWYDDGRPRLVQRVKAEIWENNKLADSMTKNIKIAPKPLVLVHGLWSSWKAWESWQNILTTTHSYDWKAFPVGEKPEHGVMNTGGEFLSTSPTKSIGENADELEKYIKYAQEDRNAWHVDIVAHSMGGLIARYYISQMMPGNLPDGRPKVEHLIMLGTPNLGSPCADVMNIAFEMAGKNVEALRQLRQDYVAGFNRVNFDRKGVKFSALAGNPLPTMCKSIVWNDGVVSVPSAEWNIQDVAETKSIHTDLTGTSDFSSFVKPRLAIGPHGDHNPAAPSLPTTSGQLLRSIPRNYGAAFIRNSYLEPDDAPFAKYVKLAPKQTMDVDVPVSATANLGITFMASPLVSASLLNDTGTVVGKNLANSPESKGWFRSIFIARPIAPTTWKLKLENTADTEAEVYLVVWHDAK